MQSHENSQHRITRVSNPYTKYLPRHGNRYKPVERKISLGNAVELTQNMEWNERSHLSNPFFFYLLAELSSKNWRKNPIFVQWYNYTLLYCHLSTPLTPRCSSVQNNKWCIANFAMATFHHYTFGIVLTAFCFSLSPLEALTQAPKLWWIL